jgi:dolichol-phosphate mannosyltransferase
LLEPLAQDRADYVKGDRLSHPEAFSRMPLTRYLGNRVLSWLTRLCTGLSLSDSQCGFTALHRRAHERVPMHALWSGYGYPNDLLGLLARERLRVHDVTVRPIYAGEASGIRLHHALFVIPFLLARLTLRRLGLLRDSRVPAALSEPAALRAVDID